jgi:hypothetical protein
LALFQWLSRAQYFEINDPAQAVALAWHVGLARESSTRPSTGRSSLSGLAHHHLDFHQTVAGAIFLSRHFVGRNQRQALLFTERLSVQIERFGTEVAGLLGGSDLIRQLCQLRSSPGCSLHISLAFRFSCRGHFA